MPWTVSDPPTEEDFDRGGENLQTLEDIVDSESDTLATPGGKTRYTLAGLYNVWRALTAAVSYTDATVMVDDIANQEMGQWAYTEDTKKFWFKADASNWKELLFSSLVDTDNYIDASITLEKLASATQDALKSRANHTGTLSADTLVDGTTKKAYTADERSIIQTLGITYAGLTNFWDEIDDAWCDANAPIWPDDDYFGQPITSVGATGIILNAEVALEGMASLTQDQEDDFDAFYAANMPIWPDDKYAGHVLSVGSEGVITQYLGSAASGWIAIVSGSDVVMRGQDGTEVTIYEGIGTIENLARSGSIVSWTDSGSFAGTHQIDLNGIWSIPSDISSVEAIFQKGQSLTNGNSAVNAISASPVYPRQFYAFNGVARAVQDQDIGAVNVAIWDERLGYVAPLREEYISVYNSSTGLYKDHGETQLSGMAAQMARLGTFSRGTLVVMNTFGRGGSGVDGIDKGTRIYDNVIRAARRLRALIDLKNAIEGLSITVRCRVVDVDQGESNFNDDPSEIITFESKYVQLQADLTSDLNAALGQTGEVRLVFAQPSSASDYGLDENVVSPIFAKLARTEPIKFGLRGPQYWDDNYDTDGVHKQALGYRRYGELAGYHLHNLYSEDDAKTLRVSAVSNSGTTLTITFDTDLQLEEDGVLVTDPGQKGIVLRKQSDGSNITLSSFAIVGTNQVTCEMASALTPSETYFVGLAWYIDATGSPPGGPTTAQRCVYFVDSGVDFTPDGTAETGGEDIRVYADIDTFEFVAT